MQRPTRHSSIEHRLLRLVVLTAVLAVCTASSALAQTYYVDKANGACADTSGALGTEASPYCTIAAAMAAHKGPGVTIIVKPGIYREQVTVPLAGAAGLPFVFLAQGPGVVLDGSDSFASAAQWASTTGTEFLAAGVTWAPKQVYADGARLALSTAAPGALPVGSFLYVAGQGLHVNLGGDNPGLHGTLVGRRNYGFNIFTKSFVTMDGFEIAHTEDRGINIQNGCTDLIISRNRVSFANSYGIQTVNGQRITIDGNVVSDCNFHGIGLTAGASACVVSNNESFRNAHPTIRQANGFFLFGAPGNTLTNNRAHDNQDSGFQFGAGSNNCLSTHNVSWLNGDHGFDHLGASGTRHVNDVAYGNFIEGFSIEGASPGSSLYNCIATENGPTTNGFNLWVDAASSVGFVSDHNLFWNPGVRAPIKFIATVYDTLANYQAASGQDAHSLQADPRFTNAAAGNFVLMLGSAAIDAAHSGVANWPALDAAGAPRIDDPRTANLGEGPVTFADLGAFEYVPVDIAPVVTAPKTFKGIIGIPITFNVTASDADGDPIVSLIMVKTRMPAINNATFTPNATNTAGTFSFTPTASGTFRVDFVATNSLTGSTQTTMQVGKKLHHAMGESNVEFAVPVLSMGAPNPSRGPIQFMLGLPEAAQVDWSVFDMQGRRIFSESRAAGAGSTSLRWEGTTMSGARAKNGMYFVQVRVGDQQWTRRVISF